MRQLLAMVTENDPAISVLQPMSGINWIEFHTTIFKKFPLRLRFSAVK
ncbi:MAG TPA: hypothetical protein VNU95_10590 [Candidatus Acidoferrales bacterium]|nr:hypothetical protein [Candidatus Acidoferrales bacterium]